jgi:hypothetical protein
MRRRPLATCAIVAVLQCPTGVLADESEASFHVELAPVALRTGASEADHLLPSPGENRDTIPAARLSIRGTWGLSDTWAFEIGVGGLVGDRVTVPGPAIPGGGSEYRERPIALRATTGLTARLGVRWIPTVTAFAGYQLRISTAREQLTAGGTMFSAFADDATSDLLVGIGVGLDYRFGARWVGGVSVQAIHAFPIGDQPYDAIEIPIWLGYYWYPRW